MKADCPLTIESLNGKDWRLASWTEVLSNPVDPLDLQLHALFMRRTSTGIVSTKTVRGASGWIPWLPLGSVWSDGHRVSGNDPYLQGFERTVTVLPGTVTELTLASGNRGPGLSSSPVFIKGPIVPYRVHRFGCAPTDLRLLAVQIGDDPLALLIPTATLLQFYVGTSTLVAQAVFNGAFAARPHEVYDTAATRWIDAARGVFRLKLRHPFDLGDAHVIARFAAAAADQPTRRMYCRVHSSIVRSWVNGEPLLPAFGFPFHGRTRLKALGRRFTVDTPAGPRERFLALQLVRCSAPFPYRTLEIVLPEASDAAKGEGGTGGTIPRVQAVPVTDAHLTTDQRADPAAGDLRIVGDREAERFTALRSVRVVRVKGQSVSAVRASRIGVEGTPTGRFTTGPLHEGGTAVGRVRQTMLPEPAEDIAPPSAGPAYLSASGEMFAKLIEAFGGPGLESFTATALAVGDQTVTVNGHVYTAMPPLPGGTWHQLSPERRRALFGATISWSAEQAYLFDIERDADEGATSSMMLMHAPGGRVMRPAELGKVVLIARRYRRLWGAATGSGDLRDDLKRALPGIRFRAISHRRTRAATYAAAVAHAIRRAFPGIEPHVESRDDAGASRRREEGGDR